MTISFAGNILKCTLVNNKANLRDLIAATGLVILFKFDPNHRFFGPCELDFWWMTSKNNRAPVLYFIELCASFQIRPRIQTEVTVRKRSIRWFFCPVWPWDLMDDLQRENNKAPLLYFIKLCVSFQSHGWIQTGVTVRKHLIRLKIGDFWPAWPWNWEMTLENNRAPLLHYINLCSSLHSHQWIKKTPSQNRWVLSHVTLKFDE